MLVMKIKEGNQMTRVDLYEAFGKLKDYEKQSVMREVFAKFQCLEEYGYAFTAEQFFNIVEKVVSPKQSQYIVDDVYLNEEDLYDESELA